MDGPLGDLAIFKINNKKEAVDESNNATKIIFPRPGYRNKNHSSESTRQQSYDDTIETKRLRVL